MPLFCEKKNSSEPNVSFRMGSSSDWSNNAYGGMTSPFTSSDIFNFNQTVNRQMGPPGQLAGAHGPLPVRPGQRQQGPIDLRASQDVFSFQSFKYCTRITRL